MSDSQIKNIIEGVLMSSEDPLTLDDLHKIIDTDETPVETSQLKEVLVELISDYETRGVVLKEVASGYRFQVRPELSPWISKLFDERPPRYSRALLETLALIAYRQPITRAEIEEVRGVTVSSNIIKTLLEHEWVRVVGYKEVPGKPALFATTRKFLDHFNLKTLEELPPLIEFTETMLEDLKPNVNQIALAGDVPLEVDESAITTEAVDADSTQVVTEVGVLSEADAIAADATIEIDSEVS